MNLAVNQTNDASVWTDSLKILPVRLLAPTDSDDAGRSANPNNTKDQQKGKTQPMQLDINITSFNVLAESYLTPRSHKNLPDSYSNLVFNTTKRRELLCNTLTKLANQFDILCLQEVDSSLHPVITQCLGLLGFGYVYCPRGGEAIMSDDSVHLKPNLEEDEQLEEGGNQVSTKFKSKTKKDSRSDGCATFFKLDKWSCQGYEVVQFDDLADDDRPSIEAQSDEDKMTAAMTRTPSSPSSVQEQAKAQEAEEKQEEDIDPKIKTPKKRSANHALPGIIASYQRRNAALILRLKSNSSSPSSINRKNKSEIVVGNAHLYWHPGYEFVKLSQAHYLLHKIKIFANTKNDKENSTSPAVIVCGDMNSKPNSVVHQYFTKGHVDARTVAPWYYQYDESLEEQYSEMTSNNNDDDINQDPIVNFDEDNDGETKDNYDDEERNNPANHISQTFADMRISELSTDNESEGIINLSKTVRTPRKLPSYEEGSDDYNAPRYLVDITLNKFTRWLRILGLDAEIETEEEEKARTRHSQMVLFEKCKKEKRTLVTTSKTLLKRKDCPPGAYLVNPRTIADLEAALVHLLLLHAVALQPRKFLTRCVVCNGTIKEIHKPEEKTAVFQEYGFPGFDEDLDVYRCNKCGQGYWWSDAPQSSASRVKDAAARLLRICVRGGVPTEGKMDFFDFVDVDKEREHGEQQRKSLQVKPQGNTGGGIDEVMLWLRDDKLGHDFKFRSSYATEIDGKVEGELNPFTNVTSDFVGALDYIFFEQSAFQQKGRLFIPTNFTTLNSNKQTNGHLLPSDIWPSDHLAIGAQLALVQPSIDLSTESSNQEEAKQEQIKNDSDDAPPERIESAYVPEEAKHLVPQLGCECGCVPPILSLFQMAELRKQARQRRQLGIK